MLKLQLPLIAALSLLVAGTAARGRANSAQFPGMRTGVMVSGTVSDDHGSPVSVARVQLETSIGDFVQAAMTDSSGSFFFSEVRPGNYQIVVNASGFQLGTWSVEVGNSSLIGLTYSLTPLPSRSGDGKSAKGPATVSVRQLLIPKKAREEFDKAEESDAHGKTDEAISHWQKSIEIYPKYAESYMQLSRVYANQGDSALATQAAQRAVALDGNNPISYNCLGYAYMKAGNVPQAQKAFEKAVDLSSVNWFGHFWLGQMYFAQGDDKDAFPQLLAVSQLKPQIPAVYITLYNDLVRLGHTQEAKAQLDYFLKQFPKDPMAKTVRNTRTILEKTLASRAQTH